MYTENRQEIEFLISIPITAVLEYSLIFPAQKQVVGKAIKIIGETNGWKNAY